uniref:Uncharacterized protein n=1 Tax=viral metagenome TaxID=1070528 RepID=A0A6C0J6Y1_9ZZZZ
MESYDSIISNVAKGEEIVDYLKGYSLTIYAYKYAHKILNVRTYIDKAIYDMYEQECFLLYVCAT